MSQTPTPTPTPPQNAQIDVNVLLAKLGAKQVLLELHQERMALLEQELAALRAERAEPATQDSPPPPGGD